MDPSRFDYLARLLTSAPSRRRFLGGLVAALGLLTPRVSSTVAAKKKNKQNLKRNAFGCVDVGGKCRGNSANCCSGVCEGKRPKKGKKDKSTCVAHNVGECLEFQDACEGVVALCGTGGACARTTGKASFCGLGGDCRTCSKDADCAAEFGLGAACIVCLGECDETGNTACVPAAD